MLITMKKLPGNQPDSLRPRKDLGFRIDALTGRTGACAHQASHGLSLAASRLSCHCQ
ncbi:hypothetical protein METHB2_480024 [Candidatus Methylobacter favarea]|uniref:Uncharacterized protein n=1 Tax=Candidatus Methylobacter favarea TaxID=2707345 RepID=A0A8S0XJZ5_9GAMM|nr:hypothetical protein METHB2_480024 [Candidatus Methylobacter favarea]